MSISTQKAALTREEKAIRGSLEMIDGDRGLWNGLSAEDLQRNKNFRARIVARLKAIEEERRALEKQA